MKPEKRMEKIRARYDRLRARLAKVGWAIQGTVTERYDDRVPDGAPPRGPYYQWTFKRDGKTVTRNLTATQAGKYRKAIENQRRLDAILREMRALSLEYLQVVAPRDKPTKPPKGRLRA